MPFDVKEPDHIDAMRALHDAIINNDAIPDVGSILDQHLPSQAHKDLLQSAAMREAQMTHEGGSASAFDDSLLGNATKAVQSLPEHTAYKLAGLINSDDPHELAAGVKFLEDITKGPEAEEYTLTPEQNIGAVKGLARAAATIPENVIGLPADIANAVKDVASWSIKKLPTTANIIRKTWDPEYARAAQYENPTPDYEPAVVKYLDTHEVPLNSDQFVDLARKYNLAPQESSDPWVEAVTNLADVGMQFTAVPKLYGKLSNATGKLAKAVSAASPDIHAAYYQRRYGVLPKDYESNTVKWTIPKDKSQSPLSKLVAPNNADLVPNYAAGGAVRFSKIGAVEKGIAALTKAGKAAQTVEKLTAAEIAAKDAAKAAELAKAEETTVNLRETHPWTIGVTDSPLSNVKLRVPLSDLTFKTRDIGTLEPKKIIQPSDLMGHVVLPLPADRQVAGKAITEINGLRLDDAVNELGGPLYMLLMHKYGQAFANAPAKTVQIVNKARRASDDFSRPVALVYSDMSGQSGDFNNATADLLNKQTKLLDIHPSAIEKFDNHIRTIGGRSDWAGLGTPEGDAQLAEIPEMRKAFVRSMDTKFAQDAGFPSVAHARAATIEPDLLNPVMRAGRSGYTIGLLDPYTAIMDNPVVSHPAFPGVIGGRYLGSLERTVPTGMMYPDLWKKYGVDPSADPDTTNLQTLLYQLDRVIPTSVVDQKMVDELSAHIEKQKKED